MSRVLRLYQKNKRDALGICSSLGGLLLSAGLALASEGHEAAGAAAHGGVDWVYLFPRFLNFGLMLLILILVLRKSAIGSFFASRREEIKQKLEELKRGKEEAERRCRELEQTLKAFEAKKKDIIEQFKSEGLAEKEKIIAEAQERAKQILEQAEFTIQREMEAARTRIRQEIVELAAKKAQEIITQQLKDSDQDHLVNEFIERVEKLH